MSRTWPTISVDTQSGARRLILLLIRIFLEGSIRDLPLLAMRICRRQRVPLYLLLRINPVRKVLKCRQYLFHRSRTGRTLTISRSISTRLSIGMVTIPIHNRNHLADIMPAPLRIRGIQQLTLNPRDTGRTMHPHLSLPQTPVLPFTQRRNHLSRHKRETVF